LINFKERALFCFQHPLIFNRVEIIFLMENIESLFS